jgi:hypothetical protein
VRLVSLPRRRRSTSSSSPPWRIALAFATLLAIVCGVPGRARAGAPVDPEPPSLALEWHAAVGCPDEAVGRAAIERYLGADTTNLPGTIAVAVELAPDPEGEWRGHVALTGDAGEGNRRFHGPTCDEVADAAALIVAILLNPLRTAARVRAAHGSPADAPARGPDDRALSGVWFHLGLQAGGDVGSLPAATLGFGLVAGVQTEWILLQVEGDYWLPQRVVSGPSPGSGGQLGLVAGSLRGCVDVVRTLDARLRFGPCLRPELGVATGSGFGLDQPARSRAFWAALFGGLSARFSTAPLETWLSLDVGSAVARPTYGIDGFGTVFQASPVLLRAGFGVGWTFR